MNNDCFDCQAEGQVCEMCGFVEFELDDYKKMLEEVERERAGK
jgi:Leu/Phe-tRNA-protein transferase